MTLIANRKRHDPSCNPCYLRDAPAPLSISDLGLINSLHGTILFSVNIAPSK